MRRKNLFRHFILDPFSGKGYKSDDYIRHYAAALFNAILFIIPLAGITAATIQKRFSRIIRPGLPVGRADDKLFFTSASAVSGQLLYPNDAAVPLKTKTGDKK